MAASGVRYSTKVKVDVVLAMAEMNGNASLAMELYASRHPHRPLPTRPTFTNLFRRFCTTGSVHLPRRTRKAIVDEDFEIDVVACVTSMPELSIRQIADQCGRSIGTVTNVLRKHKFHPYHVYLHQDLNEADFERRVDFCNWGLIKTDQEMTFCTE
ncbi:hypothetical protein HPB51_022746 [Rhipicephalus microplus]|uniref:DUF4817 domain-containing protein n=1 Tax=Rhipicephalus microplus TaxID=6941 RepID=A0A9J6EJK6_RHIMP|nr:hypothetical protein HPB51_011171 [Rhipicephalus microplus]KAH8034293.1 hypothetical protein HPB51_022746 [Rhipicephalus microplus]